MEFWEDQKLAIMATNLDVQSIVKLILATTVLISLEQLLFVFNFVEMVSGQPTKYAITEGN
jgi:hypothetical protein